MPFAESRKTIKAHKVLKRMALLQQLVDATLGKSITRSDGFLEERLYDFDHVVV